MKKIICDFCKEEIMLSFMFRRCVMRYPKLVMERRDELEAEIYILKDVTNECQLDSWTVSSQDDMYEMKADLKIIGFWVM